MPPKIGPILGAKHVTRHCGRQCAHFAPAKENRCKNHDKKHWAAYDLGYHESKKRLKSKGKGHRDLSAQFTDAKSYALISKVTALKKER